MFDYLAFIHAGISEASEDARRDGESLAKQCLAKLKSIDDNDRFPPKVLILLASPAYVQKRKAEQLLRGINDTFSKACGDVDLIGSSVGGVFFDQRVHPNGALLVCLASMLIDARVAYGTNAREDCEGAIAALLEDLGLDPSKRIDPNPLDNRLIITFMPGCNRQARNGVIFPAPQLHQRLYEGVQTRIWMIGGVSSASLWSLKKDGFQFAGRRVLRDSVVGASLITGVPMGVSLNDGLISTSKVLRVTKLGRDKRTILEFDGETPEKKLDGAGSMLAKLSADDERTVDIPLPLPDGSVQMLRPLKLNDYFQVFRPASKIASTVLSAIAQAKRRVYVERSIAGLLFPCNPYNPRSKSSISNFEHALTEIEKSFQNESNQVMPCVGGFFDGEIGVDARGRSRLNNGGVGCLIFGDEIRERTPLYKGVSALAAYGHKLLAGPELSPEAIYVTIRNALSIITETGFPGAMLSLIGSNLDRELSQKKRYIIARETVGQRFAKIKEHTKVAYEGRDILALVAKDRTGRFIPDSRRDSSCDRQAVKTSGIVSQYVLPLKRLDNSTFGTLQVDLGDLRHLSPEAFRQTEKARMLDCLAEVISASINRISNAVENAIKLDIEKALSDSLSATTVHEGVKKFFRAAGKAFGVETGELWLVKSEAKNSQSLVLETGFGASYEALNDKRREIDANEAMPICRAFSSVEPRVVNDVDVDPAFQAMLKLVRHDQRLYKPLSQTKSYAATAFCDESGNQIGAFSLGTTQPWFFLKLHRDALQALAHHLGFLIEHLRAKTARDFLLCVSPKLAERNLNEDQRIFNSIAGDFRTALNAEFASLYLWDDDTKRYILRGQSGWKDKQWVHAANYDGESGWLGVTAIRSKPLYVPDLWKYYQQNDYGFPRGRYAEYMFGQPLGETSTVEAIGLPLQIGPDETLIAGNDASAKKRPALGTSRFGVLTMYRRIGPGHRTGFITTDVRLLQQGAYAAAGLINAVLSHRANKWEEQENARRHRLYQGLSVSDGRPFEARVCSEVLKIFGATEVEFYRAHRFRGEGEKVPETVLYSWTAGYYLGAGSGKTEKLTRPSGDHSDLLKEAIITGKRRETYRVASRRREITDRGHADPNAVKTEGLVEQVCVPLVGDRRHLASLVIRWRIGPDLAFSLKSRHDDFNLQIIGRILGSAYAKQQIKARAERSDRAVQTAGLYVFQHAHQLGNALQNIYRLALSVSRAEDEQQRTDRIKALRTTAENYVQRMDWVFDFGEMIQNPVRESICLDYFLKRCWWELTGDTRQIDHIEFRIAEDVTLFADPKLTKEVFFNLMNNAIQATAAQKQKTGRRTRLMITAVVSEDRESLRIILKDNGVGMTRKQVDDAMRGFRSSRSQFHSRHRGVGVLISRFLLSVQDGHLEYVSKRGKGTEAIVTLRNFQIERKSDEVAQTD